MQMCEPVQLSSLWKKKMGRKSLRRHFDRSLSVQSLRTPGRGEGGWLGEVARRRSPTSFCFLHRPPPSLGFLSRRLYSPSQKPEEPESSEPLCFTKSPANPRRWTAWQSMGSDQRQPVWRAMLISLVMVLILLWCYLRPETEADQRAEEFLEYLRNYPLQQVPPSVPSGEDKKKP